MNTEIIRTLVDEIASEIVMAEASDTDSLNGCQSILKNLQKEIKDISDPNLHDLTKQCIARLNDLIEGKAKNPDEVLPTICQDVTAIQKSVQKAIQSKDDGEKAPLEDEESFVLPEYIEIELFREFIGNTSHVLEDIENDILSLEKGEPNAKSDLKRRIHTLKGEAGVLALKDIEAVCHGIEDLVGSDLSRRTMADLLFATRDWMEKALESLTDMRLPLPRGTEVAASLRGRVSELDEDKSQVQASTTDEEPAVPPVEAAEIAEEEDDDLCPIEWDEETLSLVGEFLDESEEGLNGADQILMNIDANGVEPEKVNALFRTFHTIKGVSGFLSLDEITKLAHTTETMLDQVREGIFSLEGAVLDLVFDSTEIMRRMLESVRAAAEHGQGVKKEPALKGQVTKLEAVINGQAVEEDPLPEASPGEKLGEILQRAPSLLPPGAIEDGLSKQKETGLPLGEELVAQGTIKPKEVSQALRAQKRASKNDAKAQKIKETVKVDLERVDRLVEMIGELVIVESMVVNADEITSLASPKVRDLMSQLEKITRDLQDTGMRMRMVPVRGVFQKMARMVRDLSRKSHKRVKMTTSGEGTEMDRSMVEHVTDPLVHMIRNAVDHAIEPPDVRIAAGKPVEGSVHLSAYHEGGSIVVEIADDGKGLDRDAILAKAKKQGIVQNDEQMSDSEIYKLIFAPGFSTAQKVTEISGRGVGMDVVKRNIESMRGRISIESEQGVGTTFKLILPLTLAIIDGMLVSSGPEQYIIPTLSIVESLQVNDDMIRSFTSKGELINVRGEIFPLLRMDRLFNIRGAKTESSVGLVVVLEGVGRKVGLVVDDVVTQQQVVIKSLGNGIKDTPYISGGAIMSDGTVGLIINVEEIASIVDKRSGQNCDFSSGGALPLSNETIEEPSVTNLSQPNP